MVGKLGRTIAVGVLVLFLVLSLGAANVTVGAERTVLNEDFVANSLAEEDAYSVLIEQFQSQLESQSESTATQEGPSPEELLPAVLTEDYLQNQTEKNIDRLYAYLHGDRDDLYLAIDTTPVKDDLAAEVTDRMLEDRGLAEFDPQLAEMAESESQFEAARDEFKQEQLQRIQSETDIELTEEQLETAYDDRREQIREEAISELETQVAESDQPEELHPILIDIGTLRITALTDPDMSYQEFTTQLDAIREDLKETIEEQVREEVDQEVPDTMVLSEQLGQSERDQLEQMRTVVGVLDVLMYVLPLLALAFALLIGWLTRRRSSGLLAVGSAVGVTGLVFALAFTGAESRAKTEIQATVAGDMPAGMTDLVVGLLDQTLTVFQTQSWLLVVLGILLVAAGVAIRRELVDVDDYPEGDAESTEPTEDSENDTTEGDELTEDESEDTEDRDHATGSTEQPDRGAEADEQPTTPDEESS